jgi:hypothetical protein
LRSIFRVCNIVSRSSTSCAHVAANYSTAGSMLSALIRTFLDKKLDISTDLAMLGVIFQDTIY